jgi:hypothetical protein
MGLIGALGYDLKRRISCLLKTKGTKYKGFRFVCGEVFIWLKYNQVGAHEVKLSAIGTFGSYWNKRMSIRNQHF